MEEEWKPIPSFPGYEASNLGRIRGSRGIIKDSDGNGYRKTALRKNGKSHGVKVHRMVMEAFVGLCPEGMEVCHNDHNRANNCLNNLRYDTKRNNHEDSIRDGRMQVKLNPDAVRDIRKNAKWGGATALASKHGVSVYTIYAVLQGRIWGHVDHAAAQ